MKKIIYLLALLVFAIAIEANQIKQSDKNIYKIIDRISALSEVAHTLQIIYNKKLILKKELDKVMKK